MKIKDWGERRWYVNGQGQTYAVIEGPVEFRMGSPPCEPGRYSNETRRKLIIPRRFAIASKEVTVEQYQLFLNNKPEIARLGIDTYSPEPDGPMNRMTWYEAAAYCNWLSEQEGLPKEQWCYHPNRSGAYDDGMSIPADALRRNGYRLPTEAEWEYAGRSGTITSRYYGVSTDLLAKYAWYQANSQLHAWPGGSLLPNELGLFDMLGNVFEWVQDKYNRPIQINDDLNTNDIVYTSNNRLLRGGAFYDLPAYARSANRNLQAASYRNSNLGFRPARTFH
jgi:formylglycine-generating enzyme required for sulfatase activity